MGLIPSYLLGNLITGLTILRASINVDWTEPIGPLRLSQTSRFRTGFNKRRRKQTTIKIKFYLLEGAFRSFLRLWKGIMNQFKIYFWTIVMYLQYNHGVILYIQVSDRFQCELNWNWDFKKNIFYFVWYFLRHI